jgi:hypothetical protein
MDFRKNSKQRVMMLLIYCRMVRTRQEIRTNLSSIGKGNRDIDFYKGREESLLKDTAWHAPALSTQARHEESTGPQVRQVPRQAGDVQPTVSTLLERAEEPPQTTPGRPSVSYVDLMLLAQLLKAVVEGMTSVAAHMPAPSLAPIAPTVLEVATTTDNVVHLVRSVKSM